MSFEFKCPHCKIELEAQDEWIGMETMCPGCHQSITITRESVKEEPVEEPSKEESKIKLMPIPSEYSQTAPVSPPPATSTLYKYNGGVQSQRAPVSSPPTTVTEVPQSEKFPFICSACGTFAELNSALEGKEYECSACCEKSVAIPAVEKSCPHCGETIKFQAKVCRFCKKPINTMPRSANVSAVPNLIPAGSSVVAIKELDTLFFWWWLSLALTIPTFGIGGIASIVFFCMLLYRYWCLIPSDKTLMTPQKAVGFLFIPVFGLYWLFESIWGLGKQLNAQTGLGKTPLETMPLILCIASSAAPVAYIFMLIGANTVFIIGVFFTLIYFGAMIAGVVFYIISMINFQNAAKIIIQQRQ